MGGAEICRFGENKERVALENPHSTRVFAFYMSIITRAA